MKILIADDSKTTREILLLSLKSLGHEVLPAKSGKEAIDIYLHNRPDLIILDVIMDDIDGFECAKIIRSLESDDWIPIIFLSSSVDDESIAKGIDSGGDDYLTKPFSEITLAAKIKAMQRIADMRRKLYDLTQKLNILSLTDPLTGLNNRLHFIRIMQNTIEKADKNHTMMALLFLDLDKFKPVNDQLGHHMGDLLLMEVATRIKTCLRVNDFVARIGGDEFAVILDFIEHAVEAERVAEKMIATISKQYLLDGNFVQVGVSIGIALYPSPSTTKMNIVQHADVAMYRAKTLGRNRYVIYAKNEMIDR